MKQFVTVVLQSLCVLAADRRLPDLCMNTSSELSAPGNSTEPIVMQGDFNKVNQMRLFDAAFSRPNEIVVCSDEKFVYGVALNLKVLPVDNQT